MHDQPSLRAGNKTTTGFFLTNQQQQNRNISASLGNQEQDHPLPSLRQERRFIISNVMLIRTDHLFTLVCLCTYIYHLIDRHFTTLAASLLLAPCALFFMIFFFPPVNFFVISQTQERRGETNNIIKEIYEKSHQHQEKKNHQLMLKKKYQGNGGKIFISKMESEPRGTNELLTDDAI